MTISFNFLSTFCSSFHCEWLRGWWNKRWAKKASLHESDIQTQNYFCSNGGNASFYRLFWLRVDYCAQIRRLWRLIVYAGSHLCYLAHVVNSWITIYSSSTSKVDGDSSMAYHRVVTHGNRNSLCGAFFLGEKFLCDVFWSLLFRYVPWTSYHPKHGRNDVSNETALPW